MKLSEYLTHRKYTTAEFATLIGADRTSVHRWLNGTTYPRPKVGQKIVEITRNMVTYQDLYEGKVEK